LYVNRQFSLTLMSDLRRAPSHFLTLFSLCVVSLCLVRAAPMATQLTTTQKEQLRREARLVVDLVQNLHYSGATFQEIKNAEILTRFLNELDPDNDFFTPDDVDFVHQRFDRSLKSVYLFRGDLEPAFEIFDLYADLARDRLAWIDQRLEGDFDFNLNESYTDPIHGSPNPPGAQSLDQRWELRLKDFMLHEILSGRTPEEARAQIRLTYAEYGRNLAEFDSFAVRERFLDVAIRSFDPHSGYSSADSTREFSARMKGIVTGVGIAVDKIRGRCIVSAIYPGGPADLHSTLAPGDLIEALAQGDGPWVDISTQRQRDTVAAMRGPLKGKLRIAYRPAGTGEQQEVTLERAEVVIGADRAYGAISQVPGEGTQVRSIGWIVLPAFYAGGEGPEAIGAARDVRALLDQMKAAPIAGLVLDLRRNPGGTLEEAVAMSQLFLPRGTVMLSRGVNGVLKTHALKEETPCYTGPLIVLTSAYSASSSEIFAGAMKLHHRALIVGARTTFGKGTVQNYIDLARAEGLTGDAVKDWGTLRLTSERFYLPDGSAMQRRGVASDIVLPDFESPNMKREADLPHALAAVDVTPPADHGPAVVPDLTDGMRRSLETLAAEDIASLPEWKLWSRERLQDDHHIRSLNRVTRSKAWEKTLDELKDARQARRELSEKAAFATQPLEVPGVKAALEAHQGKLRALQPVGGRPPLHRLYQGTFLLETDQGRLRDLRIQDIDILSLLGDSDTLAEAFSKGSGQPVTPAQLRAMLEQLALLEKKTGEAMRPVTAQFVPHDPDSSAARRGIEAMLLRITELEPQLREERPGLDIPLRESLRLAARWAAGPRDPRP